jgi:hypothetical protein
MKRSKFIKWVSILILGGILFSSNGYCLDVKLLDLREKLFAESVKIKESINPKTQDFVLLSGLFDSCILAVTQIDAYFYLLGVFEFIRKEDLNKDCFNFLLSWLNTMKKTNDLNLKNLSTAGPIMEETTKDYILKIKSYFTELDKLLSQERNRINLLMRASMIK